MFSVFRQARVSVSRKGQFLRLSSALSGVPGLSKSWHTHKVSSGQGPAMTITYMLYVRSPRLQLGSKSEGGDFNKAIESGSKDFERLY
jgi:hypothetical protein